MKVSVGEVAKRLELCKGTRPVLQGRSGKELETFIEMNLIRREPFYNRAGIVFHAEQMLDEHDVQSISQELANLR